MKNGMSFLKIVAIILCLALMSGCAGMSPKTKKFTKGFVAGGAAGAGTGAVIEHDADEEHEHWEAAGIGLLAGGILGGVICMFACPDDVEPVEPPKPPPVVDTKPPVVQPQKPIEPPKRPELPVKRVVLRGINFDFDKSDIKKEFAPVLDEGARILAESSDVKVVIAGHTDDKGTDKYNQKLSERRADSVYKYLVNKGVNSRMLSKVGYGESRPVADNKTEEGRRLNRRVQFDVMQ